MRCTSESWVGRTRAGCYKGPYPMEPPRLPLKKDCALELLAQTSLFVHLDPRSGGVMVPQWFRKQPHLVLQVGLNMVVPIHDLRVEDEGISCTLSFNRAPFFCVMPWAAIFALSGDDGRGVIWPDEVPFEVAPQFGVAQKPATSAAASKAPHLRAVEPEKVAAKPRAARKGARKTASKGAHLADTPIRSAPKSSPLVELAPPPVAAVPVVAVPVVLATRKRELPPYLRIVK